MSVDKKILIQYCDMKNEIKDIRARIKKLDRFLENPPIISDTVKGTRRDGTFGPIRITGIPEPMYARKQRLRNRYRQLLEQKEVELLELAIQAEEYIQTVPKSELRIMFRLYYIDGYNYAGVARQMDSMFPKRKYTEESVRKKITRFFEEN
ncbi:hypothetical protein D3Z51_09140 [Clostridiaceae bacterium]|nr:hypothetical protein [Clostridiaceae bacterium]RKI14466.1 hypothetical protein D7V81_08625 [bacterium 1XD21-70]